VDVEQLYRKEGDLWLFVVFVIVVVVGGGGVSRSNFSLPTITKAFRK
jgi:hypothetical protein